MKALKKPLIDLVKELNKMQESIDTLEREDLFEYMAKILQSVKKGRLISTIEEKREW